MTSSDKGQICSDAMLSLWHFVLLLILVTEAAVGLLICRRIQYNGFFCQLILVSVLVSIRYGEYTYGEYTVSILVSVPPEIHSAILNF